MTVTDSGAVPTVWPRSPAWVRGGADDSAEVDPDKEFWPAGQGAGAIDELVPAGELVERFVAEAEAALGRVRV